MAPPAPPSSAKAAAQGSALSRYVLALALLATVAIHVLLLGLRRGGWWQWGPSPQESSSGDADGLMLEKARRELENDRTGENAGNRRAWGAFVGRGGLDRTEGGGGEGKWEASERKKESVHDIVDQAEESGARKGVTSSDVADAAPRKVPERARPVRKDGREYVPYLDMVASEPIPEKCMAAELARADESYRANLARRGASLPDKPPPLPEFINRVLVPPYGCVLEQRLGKGGEGGKWVCRGYTGAAEAERSPVVVSIGSRGETTFEEDVHATFGALPDTFDPFLSAAIKRKMDGLDFLRLHTNGLVGSEDLAKWAREQRGPVREDKRMVNLTGLLGLLGKEKIDIFKIDCDGCENAVVEDMAAVGRENQVLGQIAIEVHNPNSEPDKVLRVLKGLEKAGYRMYHAEENAYYFRGCYELAYIHESIVTPPRGASQLPEEEDAQCFDVLAKRAEAIWEANWNRKGWSMRRIEVPVTIKWQDVLSIMLVADYPCAQQERFGIWDRGGAWVCLRHRAHCPANGKRSDKASTENTIVTIGAQGTSAGSVELKFEQELAEKIAGTAHVFNPFLPKQMQSAKSRSLVYHDVAVAGTRELQRRESHTGQKHLSLGDMLGRLNAGRVYLLRIDCGGCEFALVEDMKRMFTRESVPFGQISMAIHRHKKTMPILMDLKELGFRQFHSEEVGYDEVTFELSFIHESCV